MPTRGLDCHIDFVFVPGQRANHFSSPPEMSPDVRKLPNIVASGAAQTTGHVAVRSVIHQVLYQATIWALALMVHRDANGGLILRMVAQFESMWVIPY
jgi:hypothetical protein